VELASKVYEFFVMNRHYIIFRVEIKGSKTTAWYAIEQDNQQIKQHFMLVQDKPGTMSLCNAIDSKLIRKTEFHGDYYNAEEALPHILAVISIQELKGH
jgi:hypothetical protein